MSISSHIQSVLILVLNIEIVVKLWMFIYFLPFNLDGANLIKTDLHMYLQLTYGLASL